MVKTGIAVMAVVGVLSIFAPTKAAARDWDDHYDSRHERHERAEWRRHEARERREHEWREHERREWREHERREHEWRERQRYGYGFAPGYYDERYYPGRTW